MSLIDLAHAGWRNRECDIGVFAGGKRRGGRRTVSTKIIERVDTRLVIQSRGVMGVCM